MGTFSHRESVFLGCSPRRSSINHPISSPDSPDIDFHDVFGGPPRRASIQEMRNSFSESIHAFSLTSYEETSSYQRRWSGLSEKPVFGDESVNRRRYPSDDFFDDIYRGGESLCSSPRKNDTDPFSSAPGSRVLSPARPLPPRASEPFASSSLPAQFSLPAKLIKGTDLPTFGSIPHNHHKNKDGGLNGISFYSHSPLSRLSNQVREESKNDVSFKSSLSREQSRSTAELTTLQKSDAIDKGSNPEKDSNCSETTTVSPQFHFSIYKWASKGVPLALPFKGGYSSKTKEKFKFQRSLSASRRITCEGMAKELITETSQDTDICTFSNSVTSDAKSCEIELDKVVQKQPIEESLCKSESEIQSTHEEIVKNSPANVMFQDSKQEEGQIPVASRETPKTEIGTLRSLLLAINDISGEKESEENKVKSTKKSAAVFDVGKKISKQDRNFQSFPANLQDSPAKNRAKGTVKEFVKIFSQETSDGPNFNEPSQSRRFRWKERGKSKTQDDQSVTTTKVNEKVQLPNENKNSAKHAPAMVDEFIEQYEKHETRTGNYNSTNISKDSPAATAASTRDDSDTTDGHLGGSFREKILIKELRPDENEVQQDGGSQEEIQAIDAKIRKWSNGKEGNIRSLLSTLQYVLWPESGWKPVPLVDIIEGNAVKRSYQKALLSLHPDKLQQKGASSHQKYIAEKVFDILQEAWTHFSSLGSV